MRYKIKGIFSSGGRFLYLLDSHKVIRFLLTLNNQKHTNSKENRFLDPTPEVLEIQKESVIFEAIPKTSTKKRLNVADHCNNAASHTSILNDAEMRREAIT